MTAQERATVAAAEHVINAPKAWLEKEPPECLAEILEQLTSDLFPIQAVGIGWRIIQLEIMKGKIPKERLAEAQKMLLN